MNQDADIASLRAARYMALDHVPVTPEAHQLGKLLATEVATSVITRSRKRRGKRRRDFERAAGAFAADLLKASRASAAGWASRSMSAGSFTNQAVSYRTMKQLVDGAVAAGLIEKRPGYYDRKDIDWGDGVFSARGYVMRCRATHNLIELAASCGVTPGNIDTHFRRAEPSQPLVLKSSSRRVRSVKLSGKVMKFKETDLTQRLKAEVTELNRFLAAQDISGGTHGGYRRIFNQGDIEPYAWNKGGRLYSVGEDNYQGLKQPQRLKMKLNSEPVAEIDIRASYLTILHARHGIPFDLSRDPYDVQSLPRDVVKAWVTMTLGHTTFHRRWTEDKKPELREKKIDIRDYPVRAVQVKVLAALPVLRSWPSSDITCFDLMYVESNAVISTMLQLLREHRTPALSVHDSLIVPVSAVPLAVDLLKRNYKGAVGAEPHLRLCYPEMSSKELNRLAAAL